MPLYEYQCKQCGHRFEKIQSFSAPDEKECPVCHGELERLISAPAVQFKGSGWYVTDYSSRGKAASAQAKSETGGSGDAAAKTADAGESASKASNSGETSPSPSSAGASTPSSAASSSKKD